MVQQRFPVEEQDPPDTEIEEKNVKITSDGKRKIKGNRSESGYFDSFQRHICKTKPVNDYMMKYR